MLNKRSKADFTVGNIYIFLPRKAGKILIIYIYISDCKISLGFLCLIFSLIADWILYQDPVLLFCKLVLASKIELNSNVN